MDGLYPGRDLMLLRRVRMHGTRDALRAHQRFERSLAGVEVRPPGISPSAVLLVRRLEPVARTFAASQTPFSERVSLALRRHASQARRPWLHENAATADAVLFSDEVELVACLVRDWLRGRIADRWWWRSVLGDLSPQQWLRRHLLARGEALVPAIAVLAGGPDAAAWLSRLDDADADEAIAAIARTHAVPLSISPDAATAQPRTRSDRRGRTGIEIVQQADSRSVALERLIATVPEILAPALRPPQRRLLALALALTRAPSWARTPQLAFALQELDRTDLAAAVHTLAAREPALSDIPRLHAPRAAIDTGASPKGDKPAHHTGSPDTMDSVGASPPGPGESQTTAHTRVEVASFGARNAPQNAPREFARAVAGGEPATQAEARAAETSAMVGSAPSIESVSRVRTRFGGIFYLLNAALAMQLYGDFTAPRGANLEHSPWDWLALVGRAWFGRAFVRDPVWRLLAGLAGRKRRSLRRPRWLKAQIESLLARLALALGEDRSADIPALVCRYPGEVAVTATRVDVHIALSELPLAIRIAGLDRDPGWIPAAGRAIAFHFE